MLKAAACLIDTMTAVPRGYGIPEEEMVHAIRMIHGFASLQVTQGFQWTGDPDISFAWMIDYPRSAGWPGHQTARRCGGRADGGSWAAASREASRVPLSAGLVIGVLSCSLASAKEAYDDRHDLRAGPDAGVG
ncbi:hypothetical protein GCM10022419_062420 [Nonomuraea rosea]|uniref:HTH-type transcriptional regulator MT1864/Rv1816-like C-terminal domain-containing protein n=1 Tax=Nonomuraea rosea TaxID=638574 RepID=A0ABP6XWQ5_9ACTN